MRLGAGDSLYAPLALGNSQLREVIGRHGGDHLRLHCLVEPGHSRCIASLLLCEFRRKGIDEDLLAIPSKFCRQDLTCIAAADKGLGVGGVQKDRISLFKDGILILQRVVRNDDLHTADQVCDLRNAGGVDGSIALDRDAVHESGDRLRGKSAALMPPVAIGVLEGQEILSHADGISPGRKEGDLGDCFPGDAYRHRGPFGSVVANQHDPVALTCTAGFLLLLDRTACIHPHQEVIGQVVIVDVGPAIIDDGVCSLPGKIRAIL